MCPFDLADLTVRGILNLISEYFEVALPWGRRN
jgi:hypothetical protein